MARAPARRLYMGIDIAEGSPSSSKRPLYAVVVIDEDGKTVVSQSGVPLSRVIRLAWDYRPARIALDNVLELAATRRDLERVLGMFPPESQIVQVTLDPDRGARRLREKAREHGIDLGRGKLSPSRTAYMAALLAMMGEGVPVRIVEEKTIIIVSKARSPTGGGYSQRRLQRRVRASVHQAAMRVREALDRAGLDYDMSYRKSVGGLESAVFTVYAPREKLYGVVRPHKGVDYTITVKPVYRARISLPGGESRPHRPVIVGLDPGITTGIAILDLDGRVLYVDSGKGLDRGTILELVSRYGRPVVVAVDVAGVPEAARKLAAQFGATVYAPPEDLASGEKRELALRALGETPEDSHQRDALAAAYKAYLSMKQKLEHVERQLRRMGIEVDVETVKESVVRGATLAQALEEAIEDKLGAQQRSRLESQGGQARQERARQEHHYDSRVEMLQAENLSLRRRLRELEAEIERLRLEVEEVRRSTRLEVARDREVRSLRERVSRLEELVRRLEEEKRQALEHARAAAALAVELARGEKILLRAVTSLTVRALRRSEEEIGALLPGEVVYVKNPGVLEAEAIRVLAEAGAAGVVLAGDPKVPVRLSRRYTLPLVPESRLPASSIEVVAGLYVARALVREVLEGEKRRLEEERVASLDLERLVEEYRSRRALGLRKG